MYILGLSAFYHDSAAVLIKDGAVVAAMEEERLSRTKHDNGFPFLAVKYCLKEAGVTIDEINVIAYYEKPLLKFERILETFVRTYPFSIKPFLKAIPEWLVEKIKVENIIKKKLGFKNKIYFIPHHLSHAAVAYYPSSFEKAAILTVDGVGEYQTAALWSADKTEIRLLKALNFPHSLGLLYSTLTSFLGFKVNEDEYKVMGLSAYGRPVFKDKILKILDFKEDGSFHLNMKYFSYQSDFQMWNKNFEKIFGKPRVQKEPIMKKHKDLAASIQEVTEEIYFKMLNHLFDLAKSQNLCIGGGVALNSLANGKIYKKTAFKNIYIFGASSDSGSALGAALFAYHTICRKGPRRKIENLCFGSSFADRQIEEAIKKYSLKHQKIEDENRLIGKAAEMLAMGKIIGWFEGRMEFGPRALGSRSILSRTWPASMKDRVNRIKIRELFRPFAGSVLQSKVQKYFKVPEPNYKSPFMVFCFEVQKEKQKTLAAVVHKDSTCRIQTVSAQNDLYYKLIKKFADLTGVACILNTSFNLKGEPIVENPEQAIADFQKTEMDALFIGRYFITKRD